LEDKKKAPPGMQKFKENEVLPEGSGALADRYEAGKERSPGDLGEKNGQGKKRF